MIKDLWALVVSFFKIGIMTFGGGYAMLPMLQRELVENKKWVTEEEILNYFAIGQCTPGVIAVNTATFVGYKIRKIPGAIFATVGVVLPSVIIITVIAAILSNFAHIPVVQHAFAGIRIAVSALIVASVIKLVKSNIKNIPQLIIAIAAFILVAVLGQNPVIAVIGAAIAGLCLGKWGERKK